MEKKKTAKMRRQKIEKTIKSVRVRRAFNQNRKDTKIGIARDEISIKNRKGHKKSDQRQRMKGLKTAEARR